MVVVDVRGSFEVELRVCSGGEIGGTNSTRRPDLATAATAHWDVGEVGRGEGRLDRERRS